MTVLTRVPRTAYDSAVPVPENALMRYRSAAAASLALFACGLGAGDAAGRQVSAGAGVAWASAARIGIGARTVLDLGAFVDGLEAVAAFDWFFPGPGLGVDVRWWEAGTHVVYRLDSSAAVTPYGGTGVHVFRFGASRDVLGTEISGRESGFGLDLLGGLLFRLRGLRPFLEGRLEIGGGDQLVVTFGLRI